MAKQIKNTDIYQKDIFDNFTESAAAAAKSVDVLEAQLAELHETSAKIGKAAKKQMESIKIDKPTIDSYEKLEKLEIKLKEATSELAVEETKLKVQIQEKTKANKLQAKEELNLIGTYEKASKHLRNLKNEFKDATLQGTKTKKELAKMRKEVIRLDKELVDLDADVNDSFRNIGKYEQALEKTKKQMIKLAAASAGVAGAFAGVKGSLEASEEGSEELRKASGKLDAVMNVTKNTVATAALDTWDFVAAVVSGEKSLTDIGDAYKDTGKKIDSFGKDVRGAVAASDVATDSQITLEKVSRRLRKEVEVLNGEIDRQNALAGDTTLGMDSIAEATEKAIAAEVKRNAILVSLAQSELDIINARIAATSETSNNLALKNEQAEKEIELITLANDLRVSTIDLEKEINVNNRDRFEKGLDFALDLFDTQKTLNERGIADETKTFNERVKLLNRTKDLSNEAFEEQIRLAEKQVGKRLSLNELVAIDDQKVIYDRITASTTDEIVQQRLLDIIRDRKTAILDLKEAEQELNLAIKTRGEEDAAANNEDAQKLEDAANELAQFRLDLAAETATEINDIEDKSIDAAIYRAGILLNNEELNADQRLLIEEQLQEEIRKIKDKALEDDAKRLEEQRKEIINLAKDVTGEIGEQIDQRVQDTIDGYDSEIDARKSEIDRQEGLASEGAKNEIAFQEGQLAKAEINRKEALEKQRKIQEATRLGEIFLTSFEARLSSNPDTAATKAIQDTFLAKGIASGFTQIAAREKGGVVKGGEQLVRMNEKGEEFVIDAPTTKALGLDKTGSSMMDFNNMLSANSLDSHNGQIMMPKKKEHDPYLEEMKGLRGDMNNQESLDVKMNKYGDIILSAQKGGQRKTVKFKTNPIQ